MCQSSNHNTSTGGRALGHDYIFAICHIRCTENRLMVQNVS